MTKTRQKLTKQKRKRHPNWGGARPGGGRKPTDGIGVQQTCVTLRPDQIDWLRGKQLEGNVSARLRQLIDAAIQQSGEAA